MTFSVIKKESFVKNGTIDLMILVGMLLHTFEIVCMYLTLFLSELCVTTSGPTARYFVFINALRLSLSLLMFDFQSS